MIEEGPITGPVLGGALWVILLFHFTWLHSALLCSTSPHLISLHFMESLHPTWGLNSGPQYQESHVLKTEPARHPILWVVLRELDKQGKPKILRVVEWGMGKTE